MSRYLGPLWKKSRSLKFSLSNNKELSKGKKKTTNQISFSSKKRRITTFALQIKEKQKIKFLYGWREKQVCRRIKEIQEKRHSQSSADPANIFMINSETRLDNLIYRSGFAPTRNLARQLASHSHFSINGKKINSPSYFVKPGEVVILKHTKLLENPIFIESLKLNNQPPKNIEVINRNKEFSIKLIRLPNLDDKELSELKKNINTSLVTEWYNRRI